MARRPAAARRTSDASTRVSVADMLDKARVRLARLPAVDAFRAVHEGAALVDVRTTDQIRADGSIPSALEISLNVLEWRLDPDSPNRHTDAPDLDTLVIVICNQGFCSSLAASRLQDLGFSRATDIVGGFEAWRAERLPITFATSGSGRPLSAVAHRNPG